MLPCRRASSTSASTTSKPVRTLAAAWLAGSALAAGIVLASSRGHITAAASSDGLVTLYVAAHLDTPPADIDPVVSSRGTSLRYGRIGMPAGIWLFAAGRPAAMPWSQVLVVILAAGAASAAAASILPGAGPLGALLPFAAPGIPLSIAGGYPEILAAALCLWAVLLATRRRWLVCAGTLAAAMLTRENAIWVLAALGFFTLIIRRDGRATALLATALLPVGIWYAYIAARYGYVPPLDPYLRETTDTVGTPLLALLESLFRADSAGAALAAWIHVAAGAVAVAVARRSLAGLVAAFSSLQLLVSGPFAWHFVGHAARTSALLELFVVIGVAAALRPGWGDRSLSLREAPA